MSSMQKQQTHREQLKQQHQQSDMNNKQCKTHHLACWVSMNAQGAMVAGRILAAAAATTVCYVCGCSCRISNIISGIGHSSNGNNNGKISNADGPAGRTR